MDIHDLYKLVIVDATKYYKTRVLFPECNFSILFRRIVTFLSKVVSEDNSRILLHKCALRQIYPEPNLNKAEGFSFEPTTLRKPRNGKYFKRVLWVSPQGHLIYLKQYTLDSIIPDSLAKRLVSPVLLSACYSVKSLGFNPLRAKRRFLKNIIRFTLNIIVSYILEGNVFKHNSFMLYVGVINKNKLRTVKSYKKKQLLLHSNFKRFGVILKLGKPHNHYVRLTKDHRYELYTKILNGCSYETCKDRTHTV